MDNLKNLRLLTMATAVAMTACGGGGDDAPVAPPPPASPNTATISSETVATGGRIAADPQI